MAVSIISAVRLNLVFINRDNSASISDFNCVKIIGFFCFLKLLNPKPTSTYPTVWWWTLQSIDLYYYYYYYYYYSPDSRAIAI